MSADLNNTTLALIDEDHPSVRSYCIGLTISALCMPGLIGNVLVSYVEIAKGFLTSNNSSMYNLSFNLIVADTIHLALLAFYLGPSSVVQSWLLPDNWTREIPGRTLMLCWYNMLLDLCLLGFNRYFAVCRPQSYATAFSKRNTRIMIVGSWIGGFLLCLIAEQLMPCCPIYMFYKVYSYAFLNPPGTTNYNDIIILLPVNTLTSVIVIIAYGLVIYNVHVTNNRVADKIAAEAQHRRRVKEVRYAFQLIIVSAVFVSVWLLFNIFANVIPTSEATTGYFSVVIVLEIINASANSIVCILFNKEINGALKKIFCCCCGAKDEGASTTGFQVVASTRGIDVSAAQKAQSSVAPVE